MGSRVLSTNATGGGQALLDGSEFGFWCAAPQTSPFGAGTVVLAYAVMTGDADAALALPPTLLSAATARFVLSAPGADLQSDVVLLNDAPLALGAGGKLLAYPIAGRAVPGGQAVVLPRQSYGFVAFDAQVAACA